MIRVIDGATEQFLTNLARIQDGTARASREVTSGIRVERPSDDPASVGEILMLRRDIGWTDQVVANLDRLKAEAGAAESALTQAVQLMDQAMRFGSQGAGSTVAQPQRQTLAEQVRGVLEQLVSLSRTSCDGRFIFSGDMDGAPMYELDLGSANGVTQLAAADSTRQVLDADGSALPATRTAQEVFDDPQASVFASVNSLRLALVSGNETDIGTALESLRGAADALNVQLGHCGHMQASVDNAANRANEISINRETELSALCDADLPAAILALNQGQLQEEAALSARGRLSAGSLFDYL